MDIEDYIRSGVLEQYLAGDLSPSERKDVELMVQTREEVRKKLEQLKSDLHKTKSRETTMEKTPDNRQENENSKLADTESKLLSPRSNALYYWRALGIGAMAFLLATLVFYYVYVERINQESATLKYQNNSLVEQLTVSRDIILQQKSQLELIQDKQVKKYTLNGLGDYADSYAALFWNTENNRVWLNSKWLPRPDKDKQYQLWAVQGTEMIDLGVIADAVDVLQKMRYIKELDEFLITLEPYGGNTSPTLDQTVSRTKF